jgi:hypothetical protein
VLVQCVDNITDPLSGTYTFLEANGRSYINFNADGTFTTSLMIFERCSDTSSSILSGNGVEYGVYTWERASTIFSVVGFPLLDTNGNCGFYDADLPSRYDLPLVRTGNTIDVQRPAGAVTFTAVDSDPTSLVGAFVPEANNGTLLVFHADGTFAFVETQRIAGPLFLNGQERGCYAISGAMLEFSVNATCRPDGFPSYDNAGASGLVDPIDGDARVAGRSLPFTLVSPTQLILNGVTYRRTQPN